MMKEYIYLDIQLLNIPKKLRLCYTQADFGTEIT